MEARICEFGFLEVKRSGGSWKDMLCPFGKNEEGDNRFCGDWCPHFGDIELNSRPYHLELQLCHGKLLVIAQSSFTDGRE